MCFFWKKRQYKLGIDDFGHPLHENDEETYEDEDEAGIVRREETEGEETPLLVKGNERVKKSARTLLKGVFIRR